MDPSSLIFVVIVAIWAAYLLGHWVRRRDQVATMRSIDRFSEAMRVLERRPAVHAVPLSRPNPRSYVVAPVRRPPTQVSVKRAAAVTAPPLPPPPQSPGRPATGLPARCPATTAGMRRRALSLLAGLVAVPVAWALVGVALAPWPVGMAGTVAFVALLTHLRRSARRSREQARRRVLRQRRGVTAERRQSRREVVGQVVAQRRAAGSASPDTIGHDGLGDGEGVVALAEQPEAEPATAGWSPVPVPPPTYTLKPRAPRVARPAPAADVPAADVPGVEIPAATGPTFDLDEILERRIASGS